MNPYDQAHQLAKSLKESEEYREYVRLRDAAYDDGTNKALLDEYKRLQFRMQARAAAGETMPDVSAYLLAEFRYQRMLSEIFKILADTAGVDLDMLAQG